MSNIIYKIIRKLSMIILYHVFRDKSKYLSWFGLFAVGYKLNLKNPKTFNEKINWYKLNYRNPLMIKATDKLLVKEYLKEKGLESIIVPTIKVFDTLDQIKYESLPDKFVMKTNSDSGGVCNKLTKDSYIKGMAKINKCLMNDFSKYVVEWNYKDINKIIFIESLIETSNQKPPIDYKVFCFNGEPKFLYIATDRPKSTKFDFYDINWNRIHVKNHYPNSLKIMKNQRILIK